jgi:opacity protein-like surface antigen
MLAVLSVVGGARPASAQGFISPFFGYNFSGDAGCPAITNCEDKHANYGVAVGALGGLVGFEAELAYTNDFLGKSPNGSTKVFTLMGNFMLAPKLGPIQPYGLGGVGLIRTSIETPGQNEDDNQFGWDAGGGLIAFFNAHVGVRGDVRYFHSFQFLDRSRLPNLPIPDTKLDFGRFSIAAVFKF